MKTMFETTITHQLPTSAPRHGACVELLWKIAPDEALVVGAACVLVAQKDGQREKSKMIEWAVRKKQETYVFGGKYIPKNLAFGSELAVDRLLPCGSAYAWIFSCAVQLAVTKTTKDKCGSARAALGEAFRCSPHRLWVEFQLSVGWTHV
jgi:hypothetical protein